MTQKIKVMVTGLGGPLGVTILKALNMAGLDIEVIGTDISPDSVGLFRISRGYLVPPALDDEEKYLEIVGNICLKEKIDLLLPGSEQEMKVLAANRHEFKEKTGTFILVNNADILNITTDKWKTVSTLNELGIPVPFSVLPQNIHELLKRYDYPFIIKPRFGSGSKGLHLAYDQEELEFYIRKTTHPIIQERLQPDNEEYTVGLFLDESSYCVGTIIMKRYLAAGLTYKAEVLEDREIDSVCREAACKLGLVGPCNIQLRKTPRGPQIFEINPRFSSTTVMRAYFGFNEAEMAVRKFLLGEEIKTPQVKKGFSLRFWHEVYVSANDIEDLSRTGFVEKGIGIIIDNI